MPPGNQNQRAVSTPIPPYAQGANRAIAGPVQPGPGQSMNTLLEIEPQPDSITITQRRIVAELRAQEEQLARLVALYNGLQTSIYPHGYSHGNPISGPHQESIPAPRPILHISQPPTHGDDLSASLSRLAVSAAQGAAAANMLHGISSVGSPVGVGHQVQLSHPASHLGHFTNAPRDVVLARPPGTGNGVRPPHQRFQGN